MNSVAVASFNEQHMFCIRTHSMEGMLNGYKPLKTMDEILLNGNHICLSNS